MISNYSLAEGRLTRSPLDRCEATSAQQLAPPQLQEGSERLFDPRPAKAGRLSFEFSYRTVRPAELQEQETEQCGLLKLV